MISKAFLFLASASVCGFVYYRSLAQPANDHSPSKELHDAMKSPAANTKPVPEFSRSAWSIKPLDQARINTLAKKLSPEDAAVILNKGTEPAFCGNLLDNKKKGVYICKLCGLPLFSSEHKFNSGTGWPSFFQPFDNDHIRYIKDTSHGMTRVEILCARSGSHLGHVFEDGPAPTGLRYCLNSASLEFIERQADGSLPWPAWVTSDGLGPTKTEVAYFGGGCFWGLEERFQDTPGVINSVSGYMGGKLKNPTYQQVCQGDTGHAEVVKVEYDPTKVKYEDLLKAFFRYHDPTQLNAQGPDHGEQYRSAIYGNDAQVAAAKRFIDERQKASKRFASKKIVTEVALAGTGAPVDGTPSAGEFYEAEAYHQDYDERTGHQCYIPMYNDD